MRREQHMPIFPGRGSSACVIVWCMLISKSATTSCGRRPPWLRRIFFLSSFPSHTGLTVMAITDHERVGKAMDVLRVSLGPFIEREVQAAAKAGTVRMDAVRRLAEDLMVGNKSIVQWDVAGLLKLMWEPGMTCSGARWVLRNAA